MSIKAFWGFARVEPNLSMWFLDESKVLCTLVMRDDTEETIESIYTEHVEKLYRFFYYKVLDRQTSEDLTSDTFLAFAEKFEGLKKENDYPVKYLYGIARNVWNGYLRKKYKFSEYYTDSLDDFSKLVDDELVSISVMDLRSRAMKFIEMLPDKQRDIAKMRLIEEIPPKDIAKEIGKSTNYVKVTQRRAMRNLERLIAESYLSTQENKT